MLKTIHRISRAYPVSRSRVLVPAFAALALFASACGGGSEEPAPTQASAPELPTLAPTQPSQQPTQAATSPTPAPSPSVSPTTAPAGDPVGSMTAAMSAIRVSPLTLSACQANNPEGKPCIDPVGSSGTVAAGLAEFAAGDINSGPFRAFAGRTASGEWKFWFATFQPRYIPVTLPGDLMACRNDGTVVRGTPSASGAEVGKLARSTKARVEEFQLTAEGSFKDGTRGEGWYRVSGSVAGWVNSKDVTDAGLNSCELRDAIEEPGTRG